MLYNLGVIEIAPYWQHELAALAHFPGDQAVQLSLRPAFPEKCRAEDDNAVATARETTVDCLS